MCLHLKILNPNHPQYGRTECKLQIPNVPSKPICQLKFWVLDHNAIFVHSGLMKKLYATTGKGYKYTMIMMFCDIFFLKKFEKDLLIISKIVSLHHLDPNISQDFQMSLAA